MYRHLAVFLSLTFVASPCFANEIIERERSRTVEQIEDGIRISKESRVVRKVDNEFTRGRDLKTLAQSTSDRNKDNMAALKNRQNNAQSSPSDLAMLNSQKIRDAQQISKERTATQKIAQQDRLRTQKQQAEDMRQRVKDLSANRR